MNIMKNVHKVIGAVILLLIFTTVGCATEGVEIGNRAPDFELLNLDNQVVSLGDFKGQPVLINFWATWCGPCRSEIPYLQQINEGWSADGLVILAIDIGESQTTIEEFFEANKFSLPVLLDVHNNVTGNYGITGIPTTFFIDKDGIIREKVVGAFPSKEAIEAKLDRIIQ
jgi:thiol-disulfide isomerase/thioredoxin